MQERVEGWVAVRDQHERVVLVGFRAATCLAGRLPAGGCRGVGNGPAMHQRYIMAGGALGREEQRG